MTPLLIIGAYLLIIFGFCLYDALVGFGYEFDGYEQPPLILVAIVWPLAIPLLLIEALSRFVATLKYSRIERQKYKKQLRVAAQKELEKIEYEVEQELTFNEIAKDKWASK